MIGQLIVTTPNGTKVTATMRDDGAWASGSAYLRELLSAFFPPVLHPTPETPDGKRAAIMDAAAVMHCDYLLSELPTRSGQDEAELAKRVY